MMILRAILVVIEAVSCLLLIALVLVQKSKGEGLGLAFGSGVGETLFGSRAGNVLTKGTIILGIVFMANTLVLAIVYSGADDQSLMGRQLGSRRAMPAAEGAARPAQPAPPPVPGGGAPTLPGASLDDEGVPAPQAPEMPAEESEAATPEEMPASE